MIKFENVSLQYVEMFYSLVSFSHQFEKNTLIIGDELSGANSILRLIAKFDKQYSGNIFIDNTNLKNIKDKNLNIAFVSAHPYIFKFKNLEYNLGYSLKIRKINKKLIKNEINNIICKYNLQNLNKKNKYLTLSEKKLITLLRAIIWKPKYLLLENFFENLDEIYFETVKLILNDYNGIIIACEKQNFNILTNFNILELDYGVLKKS